MKMKFINFQPYQVKPKTFYHFRTLCPTAVPDKAADPVAIVSQPFSLDLKKKNLAAALSTFQSRDSIAGCRYVASASRADNETYFSVRADKPRGLKSQGKEGMAVLNLP